MNLKINPLALGALLLALAVILGAFGAHALKAQLDANALNTYEIGIRYQFYHAFGLLVIGILQTIFPLKKLGLAAWCFLFGILLFSGSLYGLACRSLLRADLSFLGPVTPIGGLFFIIGWLRLAWAFRKGTKK